MKIQNSRCKIQSLRISEIFNFKFLILNSRRGGFTLIEIIMIIVVVSIAIPALLLMVGQEAKFGVESEIRITATNVAKQLMEEIKSKKWDENSPIPPGPYSNLGTDTGETDGDLSTYDDIDDYSAGAPDVIVGEVTYSRSVEVCYVPPASLNANDPCKTASSDATDYKRIQITVTAPATNWGSDVKHVTVMTNY